MNKRFLITLSSLVLLVACGRQMAEQPKSSSSTASLSASSSQSSQSSASSSLSLATASSSDQSSQDQSSSADSSAMSQDNSETSSSQPDGGQSTQTEVRDASYNGSYYSVQGKYGEVIIVNKQHPLSPDYNPGENPTAAAAFWQLVGDMRAQGYAISDSYSGFRSYDYQSSLYQSYVAQDGQANADRYSARAGYSEHQTGLAFDLTDGAGQLLEEPAASQWLAENAHKYGFVVRYLPGKEYSTGYMAETWHVRYIGQEATDIYQSGLTLEEYFGVAGGDYSH